jgi:hypothetical protein
MVNTYRKQLRKQVIKSLKIEVKSFEDDLRDHFTTTVRLIAKSFLIAEKKSDDVDQQISTTMDFFLTTLTTNYPMTSVEFSKLYKKIHVLETFPPPPQTDGNPLLNQPDIVPDDITWLNNNITAAFVTPWTCYKEQEESNMVTLKLKHLSSGYFLDRDTATAVSTVDLEPAADKPELSALIRKETNAEHKALRKEIHSLRQQITGLKKPQHTVTKANKNNQNQNSSSKNSTTRGQGKGTSTKKTNQTKTLPTNASNNNSKQPNGKNSQTQTTGKRKTNGNKRRQQGNNKQRNRKTDENNNGIGFNEKKRKADNGNTSSKPNKNGSNKRRRQSSNASKKGQS